MARPKVELDVEQNGEDLGTITLELDPEKAPRSVENFLRYVSDGFYEGTIFHRVIPTFMIQGGGFKSPGVSRSKDLHEPVENEAANGLSNVTGAVAMARTSDPHSATSQFFINVADNAFLNHPGSDGWGYCVFGKVSDGMDVVERIRNVETASNPEMGEDSQPVDPPVIKAARAM